MVYIKQRIYIVGILLACTTFTYSRDAILEFKGALFHPTESKFKNIYGNGALYGPELTVELCKQFYAFASADFFKKCGHSIGLCSPTKVELIELGFGLKYLHEFCYGDLYVGLGALPTRLKTTNYAPNGTTCVNKWDCGGIVKLGTYIDLSNCSLDDWVLDLFVDYALVDVKGKTCTQTGPQKFCAQLNSVIFGGGLGYRFN